MTVHIREAGADDTVPLLEMIQAHAEFERSEALCSLPQLHSVLSNPASPVRIFLAMIGGELAGYAAVTIDFSLWRCREWAHLDCLFIDEEHRGQNIGVRLLNAAREYARQVGADQLEWQTPRWNVDAARFYVWSGARRLPKERFILAVG